MKSYNISYEGFYKHKHNTNTQGLEERKKKKKDGGDDKKWKRRKLKIAWVLNIVIKVFFFFL